MEDVLLKEESLDALVKCFVSAKANSFENLLDPFLKICRLSKPVTLGVAKSQFFRRLIERLNHSKAVVRLTLLRLLKAICDVHPNRTALVEKYGMYEIVEKLSKQDGAVLVRELARDIMPSIAPALKPVIRTNGRHVDGTPKVTVAPRRRMRRTASETTAYAMEASMNRSSLTTSRLQNGGKGLRPARQKLGDITWSSEAR